MCPGIRVIGIMKVFWSNRVISLDSQILTKGGIQSEYASGRGLVVQMRYEYRAVVFIGLMSAMHAVLQSG
jgi:hypothetical protein